MALLGRLFAIWAMGRTVGSTAPLFARLLAGLGITMLLVSIAAVLFTLLVSGALWLVYLHLLSHGLSQQVAIIIVGGIVLALLLSIIMVINYYYRRMRGNYQRIINASIPFKGRLATAFDQITDAFLDGLLDEDMPTTETNPKQTARKS